ncbi:hypothetical protein [Azotobacter salinestris]|uniref:hypothetical protein n=1 Tax=Azotobacter salinestris TaxID=69964 RepID=UPI001266A568|nr:hypothetical protein [Azotobacter salinestris]
MSESIPLADYIPTLKDLIAPILITAIYWGLKKVGISTLLSMLGLLRRLRAKELWKAKKLRTDPLAIQRQITKEGALFTAFSISVATSLGLLLLTTQGRPFVVQVVLFFFYMLPVLTFEVWWLWQRDFVDTLLCESARIGNGFRRMIPARPQSEKRTQARRKRQEQANNQKKNTSHLKQVARRMT